MKKTVALLTVFILSMTLIHINALATPLVSEITGAWYLISIEADGTNFNPALLNMDMLMTLMEDNTAIMQVANEEGQEVAWTLEDGGIVITTGDAAESFVLSDGFLVAERFGMKMLYGREQPVAEAVCYKGCFQRHQIQNGSQPIRSSLRRNSR